MLAITEDKAKTVEELINTVNYSQDEFYVPSEFALEFVNFIKLVNGGEGEEPLRLGFGLHLFPVLRAAKHRLERLGGRRRG